MFDHIGLRVADLAASVAFYRQALAPLGAELLSSGDDHAGFGPPTGAAFWLYAHPGAVGQGCHVAFRAGTRAAVDAFHRAGLAAGARDNGPPGLRTEYSPDYYGAFLIDRDGNNIEAVCMG